MNTCPWRDVGGRRAAARKVGETEGVLQRLPDGPDDQSEDLSLFKGEVIFG